MGKGADPHCQSAPMRLDAVAMEPAQQPHPQLGPVARPAAVRPFADWSQEALAEALEDERFRGDRRRRTQLEQELWRRPGGCGAYPGDGFDGLRLLAVDADRRRLLVQAEPAGICALTLTQWVNVLSGHAGVPSQPAAKLPATPYNYGQNDPDPQRQQPPARWQPLPGRPQSQAFADECRRLEERRDQMSEQRPHTDIVEFERLYYEQLAMQLELAEAVQAAGGLQAEDGFWGARYVLGVPEQLRPRVESTRAIWMELQGMRDDGASDEEIIAVLEAVYDSPFGGPRPSGKP